VAGRLVLVLGDQLDRSCAALDAFDRGRDRVWMAEVARESTHVWTRESRVAVFLAAMRHVRAALERDGIEVDYAALASRPAADLREIRRHADDIRGRLS
jgi:deoxyribodipyrimidine photolyase-related protein